MLSAIGSEMNKVYDTYFEEMHIIVNKTDNIFIDK